jgi:hypothetical protein
MIERIKSLFLAKSVAPVYDARNDRSYQRHIEAMPKLKARWRLYLRGELVVRISEGKITRLFDQAPYSGEPRFEIEGDGAQHTRSFFCMGGVSHYIVGRYAKVEQAMLDYDDQLSVTRIWIGDDAA